MRCLGPQIPRSVGHLADAIIAQSRWDRNHVRRGHLIPDAGLVAPAALAQRLGVAELVDEPVRLPGHAVGGANCGAKAMTVIGTMLAGGSFIDDVAVLRAGAAAELFDDTRAPPTIGTWLRGFIWGTVRMHDKVSRRVLAHAWQAGLGPDLDTDLTVDFDSTICRVFELCEDGGSKPDRSFHVRERA